MNDLTSDDLFHLLIYGALGLWIAMSIPRLFRGRVMAGLASLLLWIVAFVVVLVGYSYRGDLNIVTQHVIATVIPGTPLQTGQHDVTIFRATSGEFVVRAAAGPAQLNFILDTGASTVVLQAADAARAGIRTRDLAYDTDVSTANGPARTAQTILPVLSIGNIVERNVPVLVAKPGALRENLLGMSFLDRLASFSVSDDTLRLRGR